MSESEDAITLNQAIARFLTDIAVGYSGATAATYKTGLSRFTNFLTAHKTIDPGILPVAQLQTDWAVECVRWIAAGQPDVMPGSFDKNARAIQPTPRTTTATYVAALTRFYRWAARERLINLPADEYERMAERLKDLRGKVKRTILSKVPSEDVVEALLAQARKPLFSVATQMDNVAENSNIEVETNEMTETGGRGLQSKLKKYDQNRHELMRLRNTALLETLKSSGARVSEICSLTRGDLDATNHRAHVVGKGSKERWLYFSPTAWECVQTYLSRRSQIIGARRADTSTESQKGGRRRAKSSEVAQQPLFARHDRRAGLAEAKPLTPRAVQVMLWELVEAAGLETTITPHKFRHWFATHLLAATGDLAATQDLLGHASPNTTRIYAQVSEQKKQDIHRAVFDK